MKKYRLTKITVKTREIISVSATVVNENSVCPTCHSPIPAFLPAKNVNDAASIDERTNELSDAELKS